MELIHKDPSLRTLIENVLHVKPLGPQHSRLTLSSSARPYHHRAELYNLTGNDLTMVMLVNFTCRGRLDMLEAYLVGTGKILAQTRPTGLVPLCNLVNRLSCTSSSDDFFFA